MFQFFYAYDIILSIHSNRLGCYLFDCMKIQNECVPCLFKRILYEISQSTTDEEKKTKAIREAAKKLSKIYDPQGCSAHIATQIHRAVYTALDDFDPYKSLKEQSNKVALRLLPNVERLVKESKDPLHMSMLCSIVGNMLDFGIDGASSHPEKLLDDFGNAVAEGLGYDDYPKLRKRLGTAKHLLFFTDNCGEIVFDKVLCRELKYAFPNLKISLVVKGEPVLSDATIKDATDLGFESVVDDVFTTGCFAVGVDLTCLPPLVKKRMEETDLLLCKGMANYETFSETDIRPIVYLLRSKCRPIAESMQVPANSNIIKLYE